MVPQGTLTEGSRPLSYSTIGKYVQDLTGLKDAARTVTGVVDELVKGDAAISKRW